MKVKIKSYASQFFLKSRQKLMGNINNLIKKRPIIWFQPAWEDMPYMYIKV